MSQSKQVAIPVQVTLASVCVLVGEEPGWKMSTRLLARDDLIPTLAVCGPERVPVGRIKKFRAMFGSNFPTLAEVQTCGAVCLAMAKWVLAVNSAHGTPTTTTTTTTTTAEKMNPARPVNPLKEGAARVPTPEKATAIRAASERAAADINPTLTPAELRKMLG